MILYSKVYMLIFYRNSIQHELWVRKIGTTASYPIKLLIFVQSNKEIRGEPTTGTPLK